MEKIIHTGIIGFGLSGRVFHAPFIQVVDGFELTAVSTNNVQSRKLIRQRYPQTMIAANADEIISQPNIDLVIVASPSRFHYEQAKAALLAGKHVVVEKPFTPTSSEADELIRIAKEKNVILTVYHNRRFDSDFKTVKKLIQSNLLGEIVEFEFHTDRYAPEPKTTRIWKDQLLPASGSLYDLGSHQLDQALQLFGLPESVTADIGTQRKWCQNDDYYNILLKYPRLNVILKSSMLAKIKRPTFHVIGTKGTFTKYGVDIQEEQSGKEITPDNVDWGKESEVIWGNIDTEWNGIKIKGKIESETGDYKDFFINLRDAVNGKAEIAVKSSEARNVIRIIELAYQSNNEKRTVQVRS